MKIIRDTQRNCARMAAEEYRKLLNENPHCVLGLVHTRVYGQAPAAER